MIHLNKNAREDYSVFNTDLSTNSQFFHCFSLELFYKEPLFYQNGTISSDLCKF